MLCDSVKVYGFMRNWKAARVKYHYFNDEEPNVSQLQRDGKGELPQIEKLIKAHKVGVASCTSVDPHRFIERLFTGVFEASL